MTMRSLFSGGWGNGWRYFVSAMGVAIRLGCGLARVSLGGDYDVSGDLAAAGAVSAIVSVVGASWPVPSQFADASVSGAWPDGVGVVGVDGVALFLALQRSRFDRRRSFGFALVREVR